MKHLLSFLMLISFSSNAKEWKTDYFSLDLPETMAVETDKIRRLLAFTKSDPNSLPFLSIEFGKNISVKEVLKDLNESIKSLDGEMISEPCPSGCQAFYFEREIKSEGMLVFMYHYLVQSPDLTFIISYIDSVSIENGRKFIKNIGNQILSNKINKAINHRKQSRAHPS